jgi:hypothetical protein
VASDSRKSLPRNSAISQTRSFRKRRFKSGAELRRPHLSVLAATRVFFRTRRDIALEVLALRHQLGVLKRKRPRPPLHPLADEMPCSMHDSWIALRSRIMDYLGNNTIADLAKALEVKRKNLSKPRKSKRVTVARRASSTENITAGICRTSRHHRIVSVLF